MAVEVQDIQKIAITLSQLAQNYNELAQNWFDIFYNPEARDVNVKFFDANGNLESYVIPNRAKDLKYILNGTGAPTENDSLNNADIGSVYLDTSTGDMYIKQATYWRRIMSMNEVYSQGHGVPNGFKYGKRGDMYVDLDTGFLYLKQTETGTEGWELSTASGKADQTDVDAKYLNLLQEIKEANDTAVHLAVDNEIITSSKEFRREIKLSRETATERALNVARGTSLFNDAATFKGKVNFADVCTFDKVIMGTSYRALSADIAEYYDADEELPAGTLVQFGGTNEITKAKDCVNAVVSSEPAYILNDSKEMQYPTLIALSGRIPVRVVGPVKKFDKIVLSDKNGVAIVDNSCYNAIGRALEENLDEGEKLVECVVKLEI